MLDLKTNRLKVKDGKRYIMQIVNVVARMTILTADKID